MNGVGDATYVRSGTAPSNSMQSFHVGPLQGIPGWGGKSAEYTREMAAPCTDFAAIGDGTGIQSNQPLPTTTAGCAGQKGKLIVMMDNPALGAFIAFEDASGSPAGKDFYFVTASQLDPSGKVTALCLASGVTGEQLLVTRQP